MRQIELIAELVREGYEALKRKPFHHRKHALVDKALLHIAEEIEESRIAISNLQVGIDNDNAHRDCPEKHINLALSFLPHLGHAHLDLSHSIKICDSHIAAGIVSAAAAVKLIGLGKLSKLDKRTLDLALSMLFAETSFCQRL